MKIFQKNSKVTIMTQINL